MDNWRGKHLNRLAWLVRPSAFTTIRAVELHSLRRIPPPCFKFRRTCVPDRNVEEPSHSKPLDPKSDIKSHHLSSTEGPVEQINGTNTQIQSQNDPETTHDFAAKQVETKLP